MQIWKNPLTLDISALGIKCSFINPFSDSEHFTEFQGDLANVVAGGYEISNTSNIKTPALSLVALLQQMRYIQRDICNEENRLLENYMDLFDAISRLQIFLVTEDNNGLEHEIINLFSKVSEKKRVPTLLTFEESGADALGCYVQDSGAIYLWVDKIAPHDHKELVFQKVLLHEIIHMLFDVVRKSTGMKPNTSKEELLDNFLVLHCYDHSRYDTSEEKQAVMTLLKGFINSQPKPYQAVDEFEKSLNWFSARKKVYEFLR